MDESDLEEGERGRPHPTTDERREWARALVTIVVCGSVSLYIISSYVEQFEDWGWLRRRFT